MENTFSTIAKITRPTLQQAYPRERLFNLLDQGQERSTIWISGPAGSGKSTLAASWLNSRRLPYLWYQLDQSDSDLATFFYYLGLAAKKAAPRYKRPLPLLTPEYLQGLPTFVKRYFENLYSRLRPPYAVVFDNYQEVPEDSPFHELIREGLSNIPGEIYAVILSRRDPPKSFAFMRANRIMKVIGWNELKLQFEETKEIVQRLLHKKLPDETLNLMHKRTDGWVAGLVLMSEGAETEHAGTSLLHHHAPDKVFHYFASEIFDKTDLYIQDFLLMTAFFPLFTLHMAEALTKNPRSEQILTDLIRKNYFTQRYTSHETTYQYHPLFQEFLISRAKASSHPDDLMRIKRDAAGILEKHGQIEYVVTLYQAAGAWPDVVRLIIEHAQTMIAQGRGRTLEGWIEIVPETIVNETPWLLYWLGVCRMPFNPDESRRCHEEAFHLFRKQGEATGLFLSLSGISDTITYSFNGFTHYDKWVPIFYEVLKDYEFPSLEAEAFAVNFILCAITLRQPQHPDLKKWEKRGISLLSKDINSTVKMQIIMILIFYRLFSGEITDAKFLILSFRESLKSSDAMPLAHILLRDMEAFYYWLSAEFEECARAVREGLEMADSTGVHMFDHFLLGHGAFAALSKGDVVTARKLLRKLEATGVATPWSKVVYHHVSIWEALIKGDLSQASLHGSLALQCSLDSGMLLTEHISRFGNALFLHEAGKDSEAYNHVVSARIFGTSIGSGHIQFMSDLIEAHIALDQADEDRAEGLLRQALAIGRQRGYVNTYFWLPSIMSRLCMKALEAGIEIEYVQNLIRKRNLIPDCPAFECEHWPWPLKIFALGRFSMVKDGKPLKFEGKIQKRPLSMLKALIALGGRDVREDRLTEVLWPEADGDLAHQSFKAALRRLRDLLGNEKLILLKEGRLTLNPECCWVDAYAFERLLGQGKAPWPDASDSGQLQSRGSITKVVRPTEQALLLYKGAFLREDAEPWAVHFRERLRGKFLGAARRLTDYCEENKHWEKAVECCQRGLEVDDLAEQFYQRLMILHLRSGRRAEASEVYKRCQRTLHSALGIKPSAETEAIYKSILS